MDLRSLVRRWFIRQPVAAGPPPVAVRPESSRTPRWVGLEQSALRVEFDRDARASLAAAKTRFRQSNITTTPAPRRVAVRAGYVSIPLQVSPCPALASPLVLPSAPPNM